MTRIDLRAAAVECARCHAEGWHERLSTTPELYLEHVERIVPWDIGAMERLYIGTCRRCTSSVSIRESVMSSARASHG